MTTAASIIKNLPSTVRAACRKTTASHESSSPPVRRFASRHSVVESLLFSVSALTFLFLCTSHASAKTWYIKPDGTGDAPTIQAGIDSAAAGDTVIVGPGTYKIGGTIVVKSDVVLISEAGVTETIIEPLFYPVFGGVSCQSNSEINGFWIKSFEIADIEIDGDNVNIFNNIIETTSNAFGILFYGWATIENNLFFGYGSSLYASSYNPDFSYLNNNIILNGIECFIEILAIYGMCNNIIGEPGDCMFHARSFSLDPEFCGEPGSGNFYLQSDSPCAPGNHPNGENCGLIGPLPVGCGTVSVEHKTWGAVKAIYRE